MTRAPLLFTGGLAVLLSGAAAACAGSTEEPFSPPDGGALGSTSNGADAGANAPPASSASPADGAAPPATGDGGVNVGAGDGGLPGTGASDAAPESAAPVVTCGTALCHAGQSCVSGACAFATCTGSNVPGDYATLQGAFVALSSIGGTICLGAQHFTENASYSGGKALTIQGVSPAQTSLASLAVSGSVDLTLEGLGVTFVSLDSPTGKVSFLGTTLGSDTSNAESVRLDLRTGTLALTFDGVEVIGSVASGVTGGTGGLVLQQELSTSLTVLVQSSYFHRAALGLQFFGEQADPATTSLTLENNTFEGTLQALIVKANAPQMALAYFNNLFVGNNVAVDILSSTAITHGNNGLFGNTTNYNGVAVDGPGYVKSDPLLDTLTAPPGLGAGSPCRGAGDSSHAAASDFWGRGRPTKVDIGASQSF